MESFRFKKRASLAVALAVASSLIALTPVPASACGGQGGLFDYVTPNTLHVVIKPFHKQYARGDTVTVKVVVTRPAAEDPAGFGVRTERPVAQPASDVNVGIGINVGRAFLPGYGKTNNNGEVAVGIKLGRRVRARLCIQGAPEHALRCGRGAGIPDESKGISGHIDEYSARQMRRP
jgi:hypothetical protein